MKKTGRLIFLFLLMFSLVGCSGRQEAETAMNPGEIAEAVLQSQKGLPELTQLTSADADFAMWVSDYYRLQPEQVSDGAICYADGVEASEIAVLLLKNDETCKTAGEALRAYIQGRRSVFEGYAPLQAAMVKEGIVVENGRYAALLICPEPQSAKEAFLDCFGEAAESGETDTEGETSYSEASYNKAFDNETSDHGASYNEESVLAAWQSGDETGLSETNRSILDAAKAVLASEITEEMSDYEKELAIHDYITGWSKFDYSVFGRSSSDGFTDGSDTPYGVLIDGSAMCHGYSSTFQLFMDMLGIECRTVHGIPASNGVEHSWNMVKLDGDWYCVDCAWDDPIGGSPCHTYFNVTSDYLRSGSIHRWEEASVPEAAGTAYAYDGQSR